MTPEMDEAHPERHGQEPQRRLVKVWGTFYTDPVAQGNNCCDKMLLNDKKNIWRP